VLNLFAGHTLLHLNETRNDLDLAVPADFDLDAVAFLRDWQGEKFHTILLDPPLCFPEKYGKV
jgi:23S rRNA G2069 N7-methylase RlmK/C1962 C5-methylase RlmI